MPSSSPGAPDISAPILSANCRSGHKVIVLDNLVYGHRDAIVDENASWWSGEMADAELWSGRFSLRTRSSPSVHFAAFAYVGESVTDPLKYYRNNTAAALTVLEAMKEHGCEQFIFSSTCATYGNPQQIPMSEAHPQEPINAYGQSKLMLEKILADCGTGARLAQRLPALFQCLRLFGGRRHRRRPRSRDPPDPTRADGDHWRDRPLTVFGTDYPTPDGTCIRDYIHVDDLARAHIAALEYLGGGGESTQVNLGTGKGTSVKQVIDTAPR